MIVAAFIGAAARVLAGEAAASGERADQRHLAGFVLLEPNNARQRLPGNIPGIDSEQFGKIAATRR